MEELDLKELINMFWTRKLQILIIVAIFLIIGLVYSYLYVEPEYTATTTVILAQSATTDDSETITSNDLTLNQKLVSTYSTLIKSDNVLDEVIRNLNIDKTASSLKNNISVSSVDDTDLIQISVTDSNPELASRIASEVVNVFIEKVANGVYKINNAQVWDAAETPTAPSNINHTRDIIIFIFAGLVVSAIYVLIANMLDTTVKSKDDVEKKIGLTVLTTIPLCDFDANVNKRRGGRR